MKLHFRIDRAAALRAGHATDGATVMLDVDPATLSQQERDSLAQCMRGDDCRSSINDLPDLLAPSVDALRVALAERQANLAERAAKQAADEAAQGATVARVIERCRGLPIGDLYSRHTGEKSICQMHDHTDGPLDYGFPAGRQAAVAATGRDDEYRAALERDRVADAEAEAEAEAATEVKSRRQAADRQAALDELAAWADAHGSERLSAMRQMQFGDWVAVAEQEFFDAHTPAGYSHEAYERSDTSAERQKPTLPELQELRRLRALVEASGDVLADPRLQWHTVRARFDDNIGEEIEAEHYAATDVDVVAPTGKTLTVARIFE